MQTKQLKSSDSQEKINQGINEYKQVQFLKVNRYQIQQNAIFINYQPEQLKKSILNYNTLKYYYRLSLSKNIQAIQDIFQDKIILHKLLQQLAKDHQDIQKELVDFYRRTFIIHKKLKIQDYKQHIFDPLMIVVKGTHLQIKQEAIQILTTLKQWLNQQQKKQLIKLAIEMSHNNDQQNKIVSIQLIAKMTPDLDHQQNQILFFQEYSKLYNDSSVRVKKQIITELKVFGQNVTIEFFQRQIIQKFYLQKCQQKVWGVRKACVQILPQLVKITKNKKQLLVNALIGFIKDGNKIVKVSAYKIIPQFLANYQAQQMPSKLMQIYLKLMDHEVNSLVSRQNEILSKVAFYFPGVLFRAGKKSWQQMRKLFQKILHHRNQQLKKPIASSLHQISEIIGPDLSKQYMFSALDTILKDKSDSLKLNAINHLSDFVKLFDTTTRQNLIDVFLVLQKDPKKWRVRYSIAHQLEDLSKIYETQTVFKYIFPITLKLCNDNVAEVRNEAAKQIYYVIDNLKSIQIYMEMAIQSVKGYGVSEKFVQRQTFSTMIQNLYKLQCFEEKFIQQIQQLAQDPIIVVRIALAISINKAKKESQKVHSMFSKAIQILKTDKQIGQYLEDNIT